MTEKRLVVDGLELEYQGLFDLDALLKEIDKTTAEKGYSKSEKRRLEIARPEGKEFSIELRPSKSKSEYFILMLKIKVHITNIKEVEVLRGNKRTRMQEGKVSILFDAWTTTWYEFRWEQKPLFYFLRNLVDRFIYQFHTDANLGELSDDCHYVYNQVKAHLNLNQFLKKDKKKE